eukprot:10017575-Alexandrium_andersonii.AAC.1
MFCSRQPPSARLSGGSTPPIQPYAGGSGARARQPGKQPISSLYVRYTQQNRHSAEAPWVP